MIERATMLGPPPPAEFAGDGMGVRGTHLLIRLLLWMADDLDLDATAARWHDWAYWAGGGEDDRQVADERFWMNLKAQVRLRWRGTWRRWVKRLLWGRLLPWACYRAVEDLGWAAFQWRTRDERDRVLAEGELPVAER